MREVPSLSHPPNKVLGPRVRLLACFEWAILPSPHRVLMGMRCVRILGMWLIVDVAHVLGKAIGLRLSIASPQSRPRRDPLMPGAIEGTRGGPPLYWSVRGISGSIYPAHKHT